MKTTKEMIEVMQAFEDGKEILLWDNIQGYVHVATPQWNWEHKTYRVKTKPEKRLLTPIELFERGIQYVKDNEGVILNILGFGESTIRIESCSYLISEFVKYNYKWTSDRKTWHSFEIEE